MARKEPGTIKRRTGIGGSDVGALCGLNKRKTPYHLWLEKRGLLPEELFVEDNERIRWGRRLEKPIADEFAFKTGRAIKVQKRTMRHPEKRFMLANIDRWQTDPSRPEADRLGVLECKNHDWRMRKLWVQGGVPDTHYLQFQHYLAVTGKHWGSFAALFGGNDLVYFDIERDDNIIARIMALEEDFWRRVQLNEPPEFSFDQAGHELVKALYKEAATGSTITLDTVESKAKLARLLSLKKAIKDREAIEKELETWLKFQMKEAARAVIPGVGFVDWTNSSRKSLDEKAIEEAHPGLLDQFRKSSPSRRFSVKAEAKYEVEEDQTPDEQAVIITTGVRQINLD